MIQNWLLGNENTDKFLPVFYTDEMILHKWTTFYERYFPLQMRNYGTQLVQQMLEMS